MGNLKHAHRRYRVVVNPSVVDDLAGTVTVLGYYRTNWGAILAAWWHCQWYPMAAANVEYRSALPVARTIPPAT